MNTKIIKATGWYSKVCRAVDDALVEAYEQGHTEGWDEGVGVTDKLVVESGIPYSWQYTLCQKIRRLKKGKGE